MTKGHNESYRAAGVDVTAGYRAVKLIGSHAERTVIPGVLSGLGGFAGLFEPDLSGIREPVLVSGTDGVGTKLKIAFAMDKHDTVGIDCVAMCVNDIICAGARPLFFLDYLAVGRNVPEFVAKIVSGVADGCEIAGCALIGGETAEMPGFYKEHEYDLAGFSVGIADKGGIPDSASVASGDAVIGIASSGVHSNGFSLVRNVFDTNLFGVRSYISELGSTLGEALLTPTRVYVKPVLSLMQAVCVKSLCHITGGGFYENIPRMLPDGLGVRIERNAVNVPPIFKVIQKTGHIPDRDMWGTFNMGVGMCVIVPPEDAATAIRFLQDCGEKSGVIGEVRKDADGVVIV